MNSEQERRIYEELGVRPVINAAGYMTLLGGSRVSSSVQGASEAANRYFVDMEELLKRTGEIIAQILGAEAALVTSGCAAAMALGATACLSGSDPAKAERLPDASRMRNEILIQASQRYKYDRCLTIFGAQLVEAGADGRTTPEQIAAAITDRTAAIHYFAPGGGVGVVPPEEVIRIGHQHGVPVLVDAASQVYPLGILRKYTGMGADLVCYGAKYFGAYHSTGILCGRKDLVDAAFLHCFVGFESSRVRSLGRPFKVDRQEVIGVVTALREWVTMDHAARLAEHQRKIQVLRQALEGISHVTIAPLVDERTLSNGLVLTLDEAALGKTAAQAIEELRAGNPSIWVRGGGSSFNVTVPNLVEGEEQIVAGRLREVLTAR